MERELDKLIDATIEETFIQQHEKYIYDDEVADINDFCCDDCLGQEVYFLKG